MSPRPAGTCSKFTSRDVRLCGRDCGKKRRLTRSRCNNGILPQSWNPMKRIEVKLSLEVVAPLLDVIKNVAGGLSANLAAPLAMRDLDAEFKDTWTAELQAAQTADVQVLL